MKFGFIDGKSFVKVFVKFCLIIVNNINGFFKF